VAIGFHRLPNPKHIKQHVLWTLSKLDGRTVTASVRQVPHGTELIIVFKGELLWSEVFTDSRNAGVLADSTRRDWEANGWTSV